MYNNPREKSLLDQIFEKEFKTFVDTAALTEDPVDTSAAGIFKNSGAVISPAAANTSSFDDLTRSNGIITAHEGCRYDSSILFQNVTRKMLTLDGTYTIQEAIVLIENFISKAGRNFYGALLRHPIKKNIIINPYHPLAAVSILTNTEYKKTKFTIILYFYENRSNLDEQFETKSAKLEDVKSAVNKLLRLTKPDEDGHQVYKMLSKTVDKELQTVTLNRAVQSNINSHRNSEDRKHYVMSHQLLTRGMISPYYGSSILSIRGNNDGQCSHISPFLGVNISINESGRLQRIVYNGICTGSQPKTTFKGLSSLNHANLSSPLNRNTIRTGALLYADVCIDTTRELYKKAGYLKDYKPIAEEISVNKEHLAAVAKDRQAFAEHLLTIGYTMVNAAKYIKQLQGILDAQNKTTSENQGTEQPF